MLVVACVIYNLNQNMSTGLSFRNLIRRQDTSDEEKDEMKVREAEEDRLNDKQLTPVSPPHESDLMSRRFNSSLLNSFNEISNNLERVMKSYNNTITSMLFEENKFAEWSREEMIDRLIYDGVEIRDERNISEFDLEKFCEEYYENKDMPMKIEPFSPDELKSIERAVRTLQNAYIFRKHKARKLKQREQFQQESTQPERDFLYTDYTTGA